MVFSVHWDMSGLSKSQTLIAWKRSSDGRNKSYVQNVRGMIRRAPILDLRSAAGDHKRQPQHGLLIACRAASVRAAIEVSVISVVT